MKYVAIPHIELPDSGHRAHKSRGHSEMSKRSSLKLGGFPLGPLPRVVSKSHTSAGCR